MNEDSNNFKDNQSRYRSITVIGLADTIGSGIAAVFWFYLATLITPEQYGELFFVLGIAGTASLISLFWHRKYSYSLCRKKCKDSVYALFFISHHRNNSFVNHHNIFL